MPVYVPDAVGVQSVELLADHGLLRLRERHAGLDLLLRSRLATDIDIDVLRAPSHARQHGVELGKLDLASWFCTAAEGARHSTVNTGIID